MQALLSLPAERRNAALRSAQPGMTGEFFVENGAHHYDFDYTLSAAP